MALDGIAIAGIVSELKNKLVGGRIYKIYQPEVDEICLVIKNRTAAGNTTEKLVLSADASLPLMYLTARSKENPASAPNFCMLLRKHIGNGRITEIEQPGFERITSFTIEHLDEMGDLCTKKLIIEIMGKHSNIIFTDSEGVIIDSIKHISHQVSSVREVLPGRVYVFPPSQDKANPLETDVNYFMNHVLQKPMTLAKALYTSLTGISPVMANEMAYRAGLDGGMSASALTMTEREQLFTEFDKIRQDIIAERFTPCIAYDGYEPVEFSSLMLTMYGMPGDSGNMPDGKTRGLKVFSSVSEVIEEYYSSKSVVTRMKQRSADLRKIVSNAIERTSKKYDLQLAQLKDTEKRDQYKVYGELITAYGYQVQPGAKELVCDNYYTGEEISIPLDPEISAMDNGKRYFARYNKLKRTYEALTEQAESSREELDYLLSVQTSLSFAASLNDLIQIKAELTESGYIRGKVQSGKVKKEEKSKPLHYISSDGFHMYVGKNNYQNDELTFRVADGNDMWFHAKQMPGSHVIVKTDGAKELPDRTYEEAARLAAHYSSGGQAPKVDIDYTARKNLKKPPRSKPGFVIYHTNYSMTIEPDIHGIREIK
ncbi:MAG: NFACT family protein [Wujia sp.]